MYIINQIKKNFFSFIVSNFVSPKEKFTPISKEGPVKEKFTPISKGKIKEKLEKNSKFPQYLGNLKKYTNEWITESLNKKQKEEREKIMKNTMNPETVPKYVDRLKAKIKENWGNLVSKEDIAKARKELNEEIYKERKKELDSPLKDKNWNILKDKNWKEITKTKYQDILEKNKNLKKLNSKEKPGFAKELLAVYWEKRIKAISPIIEELQKEWKKIPDNLEEFDKLISQKLQKKANEILKQEGSDIDQNKEPNLKVNIWNMSASEIASTYSNLPAWQERVRWFINWPWKAPAEQIKTLNDIISKLPENTQVRKWLEEAKWYIWLWKQNKMLNAYTANWWRPASEWYYCRAFTNSVVHSMWWDIWKSALSKEALNHWKPVNSQDALPWDVIVISRHWTDTAWNPGTHVWIFLEWWTNWPIILSGNSTWWKVTVHEYTWRTIFGIRRVMSKEDEIKIENSRQNKNTKTT